MVYINIKICQRSKGEKDVPPTLISYNEADTSFQLQSDGHRFIEIISIKYN